MPKQKIIDLLYELMKNSKRSDREIAKAVKVSQPTVTRMRRNLKKSGYIREYTVIPELEKIGFEIATLNFLSANLTSEQMKEVLDWVLKNPKNLFTTFGEGLVGKCFCLFRFIRISRIFPLFLVNLKAYSA